MIDNRVAFLPYQPLEELPYSLTSVDVSIVSVQGDLEGLCVSCKLYTSMAAGRPILVIASDEADETRLVREYDAGIAVEQGDIAGVVNAIHRWRSNPDLVTEQGTNARDAFEQHFTKEQSIDHYYSMLAESPRSTPTAVQAAR